MEEEACLALLNLTVPFGRPGPSGAVLVKVASMCKIILAVALPLAVPFLEGGGRLSAQGDAVWQERFSKEAPQQWEKYRARASRLQGSWSFTVSRILDANEKQILTKRYQEHKQRKNCALYLEQSYTEGGKQAEDRSFLRVRNPRYGFQLTRSSPDGPWAISHVGTELWTRASFDSPAWWVEEITALPNSTVTVVC